MVFGLELLSVNLLRVFHLTMVFSETPYCTESSILDFVLLFISLRKWIFVVALEFFALLCRKKRNLTEQGSETNQ